MRGNSFGGGGNPRFSRPPYQFLVSVSVGDGRGGSGGGCGAGGDVKANERFK